MRVLVAAVFSLFPILSFADEVLTISAFNLKEFAVSNQGVATKSAESTQAAVNTLASLSADLMILSEIEGSKAAEVLRTDALLINYRPIFTRSEMGLDVGFMVKKSLPYLFSVESYADIKWVDPVTNQESLLFQRDVPALIMRDLKTGQVKLVVIGVHLKSMRDRAGDPTSSIMRTAQMQKLAEIQDSYTQRFGLNTPVVIAGDFNSQIGRAPEMQSLEKQSRSVFTEESSQKVDLFTHVSNGAKGLRLSWIDDIRFNNSAAVEVLEAKVTQQKDQSGVSVDTTRPNLDSSLLASDHLPISSKIKLLDNPRAVDRNNSSFRPRSMLLCEQVLLR